ncbi:MAG TPA: hemin receptor, partial [Rhodobacterales bacterium]|nr:hemin receptor [Rhodobacterales bacterium]
MDEQTITLVQETFAKVEPIAGAAAELFYADLFATAPHVKPFFKGDMDAQGMKLMTTLGVVVKGLRALEQVLPVAAELARRHVDS